MRLGDTEEKRLGERVTVAANMTVRVVGSLILLALSWYALRYTQYMIVGGDERAVNVRDSVFGNLLALAVLLSASFLIFGLSGKLPEELQRRIMRCCTAFSVLWTGTWGYWWISVVDRQPEGDQAFVYGAASYFMKGNYVFLKPGTYCGRCPHQLPLIALIELLFRVVGRYNYFAIQVINTLLAAGIVWVGYRILWEMTENCVTVTIYSILMTGCLPLIFYTGWVYGDVPGIFFAMLATWALLRYERSKRLRWLITLVLAVTFSVAVRLHSAVFLMALCLVGAVYVVRKRDVRLLAALAFAVVLPVLFYSGVYKMYELRSGIRHAPGMPSWSYVSMGMQEKYGRYGWYTIYCTEVFDLAENDPKVASEIAKKDVRERLEVFRADPAYALLFYREKILSQWNEPLYQSLYFGNKFPQPETEEQSAFVEALNEKAFDGILRFCDRMQFLVYVGTLCYFIFAVRRRGDILQHLLAVTLIGGFLFSILWEAKARYVVPYYITMFPMAIVGYWELWKRGGQLLSRYRGRLAGAETDESAERAA